MDSTRFNNFGFLNYFLLSFMIKKINTYKNKHKPNNMDTFFFLKNHDNMEKKHLEVRN
jgi:hypothetical protein